MTTASQDFIQLEVAPPVEVPRVATDEQVRSFVDDGFLVLPDLIKPAELDELIADTIKLARGGYDTEGIKPVPAALTDDEVLRNILCIHQPHYVSPVMETYVRHPQICGALSQITAAHLPHWDGSVKCMQSMLFVKPPGFQGQAWHQDEIYIPTRDRSLIGAWIAIDDASVDNGCLWVIPGSQRTGMLFPQRAHEQPELFDFAPESHGFDESQAVPVEVKRGSVVFFNGYLLHRSLPNRTTGEYRKVLVNHYMNAWSHLPWQVREGESPAKADRRTVLQVAGVDPYAWKGTEEPHRNVYLRMCKALQDKVDRGDYLYKEKEKPAAGGASTST